MSLTDSPEKPVTFSFVIPAKDYGDRLCATLRAVSQLHRIEGGVEVIVVFDNPGRQRGHRLLESCAPGLRLTVLEQEPSGPARARNRGSDHAQGEWLIFVDDDCRLDPDFLFALTAAVDGDPRVAAGGTPRLPEAAGLWSHASQIVVEAFIESQRSDAREVRFIPTQTLAIQRTAWARSGGFDKSFRTPAGEDREFCLRWLEEGGLLIRVVDATYVHDHPLSFTSFLRKHRDYGAAAARLGARRMASPDRFARAALTSLSAIYPRRRMAPLCAAVLLSQLAAAWGALFDRGRARPSP